MAKIVSWRGFTLIKAGVLSLFVGCAFANDDPFELGNRNVHSFNEYADEKFLRPVARIYEDTLPANLRLGVANFFSNLESINNALNSALQMKMGESLQELTRFCLNTTIGIGGFLTPHLDFQLTIVMKTLGKRFLFGVLIEALTSSYPSLGPAQLKTLWVQA